MQQQADEEVDLTPMNTLAGLHPPGQRRRREKKLLKIEDVNERFPVMTYKAWRAQRERAGLSAEGGIATQTSTQPVQQSDTGEAGPVEREDSPLSSVAVLGYSVHDQSSNPPSSASPAVAAPTTLQPTPAELDIIDEKSPSHPSIDPVPEAGNGGVVIPSSSKQRDSTLSADVDEEDYHAIPHELLNTTGDNCAICIDLLEDDDEVRGLTCGHCFHQTCLDPWLTQRRASCPLCKADYYIPKPPAQGTEASNRVGTSTSVNGNRNMTGTGQPTEQLVTAEHWAPLIFRPFRPPAAVNASTVGASPQSRSDRRDRQNPTPNTANHSTTERPAESAPRSRWPVHMHIPFRHRHNQNSSSGQDANDLERGDAR